MAKTFVDYDGDGVATKAFSFPSLAETDIKVEVDSDLKTASTHYNITSYTATGGGNVVFTAGNIPATGTNIRIYRDTDIDTNTGEYDPQATFSAGSSVKADDLNKNQKQALYAIAEEKDQTITTVDIKDNSITSSKIAGNAVNSAHLADNSVGSSELQSDSVGTTQLKDNAVTSAKIAGNAVGSAQIADGAVGSSEIAANAVGSAQIQTEAVGSSELAANAVNSAHIADGAVGSSEITGSAVGSAQLADNSVTSSKIAADAVGSAQISDGAVGSSEIAADAVGAAQIADGAVGSAALAADSVGSAQISDGAVGASEIAANAVGSAQISDGAVGSSEIAADAVQNAQLADNSVAAANIAANAVGSAQIADGAVGSSELASDSVGNTQLKDNAVTMAEIGCEETTLTDDDTKLPTSGAVVDYVAAQLAPIGGLEVIADDESFPNTIPSAGVVISITDAAGLTVNSSGVSTNADALDNSTITINGFPSELRGGVGSNPDPYVFQSGAGLMVQSTGSSHTYNYHQAMIRESDFVQLSDDINDFNNRYRIASSAPGSNNDEGDLYFDTGANKMYVYDGSAWGQVTSTGEFKILSVKDNGEAHNGAGPTFNGSNDQYDLFESTSDASITQAAQLTVILNGVQQKPNDGVFSDSGEGFYLDGADGIRFCDPPPSDSTLFVIKSGSATEIAVPADNSVSAGKTDISLVQGDIIYSNGTDSWTRLAKGTAGQALKMNSGATAPEWGTAADATKMPLAGGTFTGNVLINDDIKTTWGTGGDFSIYHDHGTGNGAGTEWTAIESKGKVTKFITTDSNGSNPTSSFEITNNGTPNFTQLYSNNLITPIGGGGVGIGCQINSAGVYNARVDDSGGNHTTALNVGMFGKLSAFTVRNDGHVTITEDVVFDNPDNAGKDITWDVSADSLKFEDSVKATFGTGGDLEIYHVADDKSILKNSNSPVEVWSQLFNIQGVAGSAYSAKFSVTGGQELYHNNGKKFETTSAGITVTGSITDTKGDVRKIPQHSQTQAYTIDSTDAGKHLLTNSNVTVPDSVFAAGDAVTIINNSGSNITITKGTNMYNAADGTNANRTLAGRGMATLLFTATDTCYISGAGLT